MRVIQVILLFLLSLKLEAHEKTCDPDGYKTEISNPLYPGSFEFGGSWLYLRPTATDGDLEYGSFITLTAPIVNGNAANLNALLLEIEPSHESGYQLNLGYTIPNTNQSLHANYYSLHADARDSKSVPDSVLFLIQDFLGGNFKHSKARSDQKVDDVALSYHLDSRIDEALNFNLALGVRYASIRRELDVEYRTLNAPPRSALLTGDLESRYWGVGPYFGLEFGFPLLRNFGIAGKLETGVLFGKNRSSTSSEFNGQSTNKSFFSKHTFHPAVTNLNCDLELTYSHPLKDNWGLEFKLGYMLRYYFRPVNRIDPNNGFVVNNDIFPVNTASNLGLGGPFVMLSLSQNLYPETFNSMSTYTLSEPSGKKGLDFSFTSLWLEPRPTDEDLVFAKLNEPSGEQEDLQANPDITWVGKYALGYRFRPSLDVNFSAFSFETSTKTKITASGNESISSVNASGPGGVLFSETSSHVKYKNNEYDGKIGKSIQLLNWLNLHSAVGLRYLRQIRTLNNAYTGGNPATITDSKFPILKSRYRGIGPLFTLQPSVGPFYHFDFVGNLRLAFLVGEAKATLDQDNFGTLLPMSSNDVRTPKTPIISPVFEGSGGFRWSTRCFKSARVSVEGGYEYMAYYKTVRLLLPTFLTGLEQINSNLILRGPYIRGELKLKF